MKLLSTLLIAIFILLLFAGCNKNNNAPVNPIVKDSIPFENENIKLEFAATTPFNASDFHFFNASTGIAVTEDGKIYRTADAGTTWKVEYSDSIPFKKILFINSTVGYIVGGGDLCSGNAACINVGGFILKTNDGGVTWSIVFRKPAIEIVSIAVNSAGELFAVCDGPTQIFKSADAGEDWNLATDAPVNLYDITFNKNVGFCTAQGNKLFESIDNGDTWQLSSSFDDVLNTNSIDFNNNNGYLIADYQKIYTTKDNGSNWILSLNDASRRPSTLEAISENECVAFGYGSYSGGDFGTYDGAMWLTTNAGATWKATEFGNAFFITNSSFYAEKEGYVQTPNKLIKVTIK